MTIKMNVNTDLDTLVNATLDSTLDAASQLRSNLHKCENVNKSLQHVDTASVPSKCESCINVTDERKCEICRDFSLYETLELKVTDKPLIHTEMFYRGMDKELQLLEIEIRQAQKSFLTTGKNLSIIQEKNLYKTRGFDTFESYCKDVLDITRQYGYNLIRAYRVHTVLRDSYRGGKLPQTESQCRPLTDADLSDLDVTLIWAIVVDSGKITAQAVKDAVKGYRGEIKESDLAPPEGQNLPFTPDSKEMGTDVKGSTSESVKSENNAPDSSSDSSSDSSLDINPVIGSSPDSSTDSSKESTKESEGTIPVTTKGDIVAENLLLKAQVQELELQLAQAKLIAASKNSIPRNKMSLMLFKAGYNVLLKTVSEDQKAELTEVYNTLVGR